MTITEFKFKYIIEKYNFIRKKNKKPIEIIVDHKTLMTFYIERPEGFIPIEEQQKKRYSTIYGIRLHSKHNNGFPLIKIY